MNDYKIIGGSIGTMLSAVGASMSVTEIQAVISIITTIVGLIITIITSIVIPTLKKYNEAKKDGKITLDEAIEIIEDTTKNTQETIDKINKQK